MVLPNLGIDQSKKEFDVCLICGESQRKRKFTNDQAGFRALSQWLIDRNVAQVQVCIESTGRYFLPLAEYLHDQGHIVKVVNPARIVAHRKAMGVRHKTDSKDAFVIADFAAKYEIRDWSPAPVCMQELRDIVGQLQLVKKHKTAYSNRQECGLKAAIVRKLNADSIAQCDQLINRLEEEAMKIVRADEKLSRMFDILMSVPGLGLVCSLSLLSQIDFGAFRTGRDLAVFLGLAPKLSQSGTTEDRTKADKQGDSALRAVLRQGATAAKRSKFFATFVQRFMQKKGEKAKQSCTKAVARKIVLIAHACIRNDTLFDRNYVHPLSKMA